MKKFLLVFCILMFIAASVYFYITIQREATTTTTSTPTVFIDKHWDSEDQNIVRRSMPQDCYSSKDSPECYSRNYNDVIGDNNTTCTCDVEFDGKKYHETFTIDINYKYKELIGMKSFSETKFLSKISDMYCNFVCDEFSNQIKNNTYIETAK